jgi:hypothetical protein
MLPAGSSDGDQPERSAVAALMTFAFLRGRETV